MQFLRQFPSVLVGRAVRYQLSRTAELSSYYSTESPTLAGHSQVVICGGGIVGCSVAYHLAKLGWTDIVLLEQGRYKAQRVGFLVYVNNYKSLLYIIIIVYVCMYTIICM